MQINILMFNQDDPKKCTAAKLVRFGLAKKISTIRSRTILLHPFSSNTLLNKEKPKANSITGIDCSWNKAEKTVSYTHLTLPTILLV